MAVLCMSSKTVDLEVMVSNGDMELEGSLEACFMVD